MITKTIMTLGIMASFVIGISFSSVYAGIPWGTDDIADDAITSDKIKNKQVKNADIRGNTIKSGKIRDGTITADDIAPGTIPGFPNVYVNDVFSTSSGKVVVQCDNGDIATGGGFVAVSTGTIANSFPVNSAGAPILNENSDDVPTGWAATTQQTGVRVGVVCADTAAPFR